MFSVSMATSRSEGEEEQEEVVKEEAHPYAFHISGPRNVASPNWRDLINSSWSVLIFIFFSSSCSGLNWFLNFVRATSTQLACFYPFGFYFKSMVFFLFPLLLFCFF